MLRLTSPEQLPTEDLREQARRKLASQRVMKGVILEDRKRLKYGNRRFKVEGMRAFDSKLEWRCYEWLKARAALGELAWFTRQVPFELEGGVVYRCDFLAHLAGGGVEVWDAKGCDTQVSRNKRKQVLARYGIEVKLWPPREIGKSRVRRA